MYLDRKTDKDNPSRWVLEARDSVSNKPVATIKYIAAHDPFALRQMATLLLKEAERLDRAVLARAQS